MIRFSRNLVKSSVTRPRFCTAAPSTQSRTIFSSRSVRRLEEAAENNPFDADKQSALLRRLNEFNPQEVVKRYESNLYANNADTQKEYLKALAAIGKVNPDLLFSNNASERRRTLSTPSNEAAMKELIENQSALLKNANRVLDLLATRGAGGESNSRASLISRFISIASLIAFVYVFSKIFSSSSGTGTPSILSGLTPAYTPIVHTGKTFDDVKGIDECRDEMLEIVQFLKNPEEFARLGGKLPRGVLLSGPPGTGKTLIAKAIAGEAGVPFFYASGSEFDGMLVGLGAKRISSLFESAKRHAPAIIFIDEIDALGGRRGVTSENYQRQTINQFLSELDGFNTQDGIIVIGATNLLEILDPALTRPGRFDKKIHVPLPNLQGRLDILNLYIKNIPTAKDIDIQRFASASVGFSGAELENLVNTASIRASRLKHEAVTNADLDFAFDRVVMGLERRNLVDKTDRYTTAVHETGHALMTVFSNKQKQLHKLTIMPRGPALGFMSSLPRKDVVSISKNQMYSEINVLLGGIIAEEIIFGKEHVTSGASNDLERASQIARNMVEKHGMSRLGLSVINKNTDYSPETKREIDLEVRRIIDECYEETKKQLVTHEKTLKQIADILMDYETLTGSEVMTILNGGSLQRKPTEDIVFGQV